MTLCGVPSPVLQPLIQRFFTIHAFRASLAMYNDTSSRKPMRLTAMVDLATKQDIDRAIARLESKIDLQASDTSGKEPRESIFAFPPN